ncbi:hypothetical protein CNR22_23770 [Sphingobacteriaceae bacterium]|nr:hypothetical protein CNR22_23770 [Sphingobacteriaceae bacterium]
MILSRLRTFSFLSALLLLSAPFAAQDNDQDEDTKPIRKKSRFLTGVYVASYFANKSTAGIYNGYGFDYYGVRNSFANSLMYQKIINEYGYGYGLHDQVADAIGVDQGAWQFTESDMPTNMRYTPAVIVGANFKIPVDQKNFIIVNVNGTKINLEGNFTITKTRPSNPDPSVNSNIVVCGIQGREQRLQFELGYQHLAGSDEKFNMLLEFGLVGTLAKSDRNMIFINNLQIDLNSYWNQALYPNSVGMPRRLLGFGVGGYAGIGANIDVSPKFNVQLLYKPSLEKINMGDTRKLKLQNALGLRVYYKF